MQKITCHVLSRNLPNWNAVNRCSCRVDRNDADGTIEIDVPGTVDDGPEDPEDAAIKQGDIQAGKTIIHIVDEVLVPASGSLRKSASG